MSDAQLATVCLSDEGAALEAVFVPGAGMLCCSLRHRGEELLAQNAGVAVYAERGKTMGIPLLYPWANRLSGFDYTVAGREVRVPRDSGCVGLDGNGLPIHGVIGGRIAWELTRPPDREEQSLAARLSWDDSRPELFEVFPFTHDVSYEARLHDGRLDIGVSVHACAADAVPVAFGFHPYLSLAGAAREHWLIELSAMRHLELDAAQIPTGITSERPAERFELAEREFDDGFDSVPEPALFSAAGAGRGLEIELLEGYPCAQVYAPSTRPFICFEPMTAPANALRSGVGLRLLEPGARYRARFSLRVRQPSEPRLEK